jgi:uncharacterized protein YqeY
MNIEAQLSQALKDAMRARDQHLVACIRQVKAKMQERVNAKGFKGEVDDALYQQVIGSYIKSLKKGIEELEAAGERGAQLRAKYESEIVYLEGFLPAMKSEEETRDLVDKAIASLGISEAKEIGKLIGVIMKEHHGAVDATVVRRLAESALSQRSD